MAGDHQMQHDLTFVEYDIDAKVLAADDGTVVTRIANQLLYADGHGSAFDVEWGSFDEMKSSEPVPIAIINGFAIGNKLNISGKVSTSVLERAVMYEVVFVVMLKKEATTWDVPMKLNVELPPGIGMPAKQERTENLVSKPKQQWIEILAGEFKIDPNVQLGSIINFLLDIESVQAQESGLVIKSVKFRRVSTPLNPKPIQTKEINVRELSIYRGQLKDHWIWDVIPYDSTNSDTFFEVVQLVEIVWFEVSGKYDASILKHGFTYEVVFFIRLNDDAQNWANNQLNVRINGQNRSSIIIDKSYVGPHFKELIVADITVNQETMTDGIEISLSETTSGLSKKGLVIKSVLLRQK